ncbi:MOSC domain-containing protein [Algiphilus sp. W345]|uniref:MOSC domain-containing protein n=1 Tax=Banduia mediterranea TaxID=3075609 RepID=A0ABU2WLJ3_9GAMM|nr:MOSC domain-containing protein [Algiphilus sp. W345]MDT0498755.1 MOSC domain-containing protein [Algiphilus sp. W345]
MATLSGLYIYPVKSCAAVSVQQVGVEPRGLAGDRRWMIVDATGHFITGREQPRLTLIHAHRVESGLTLSAPGQPEIVVARPDSAAARAPVVVWHSEVQALPAAPEASEWISRFLGRPARLAYQDAAAQRLIGSSRVHPDDEVSFADAYPMLLISEASLAGLNHRIGRELSMLRFRPNLVVSGTSAHAEDEWKRVRIGAVEFDVVKPCARCKFTTIDPETAERDPRGEPLRTLATYRRVGSEVMFGQNLVARSGGGLRIGDTVEVIE